MHARIENDLIVEYPIYDLPSRYGEPLYGDLTLDENIPAGFVYVEMETYPLLDMPNERAEYGEPYLKDGRWYGPWIIVPLSETEKQLKLQSEAELQRKHRDYLLTSCDWTQLTDAPVDPAPWAAYRQTLRDVPQQEGFPWQIEWPQPPQ